jgi:hypothetical protein
MKRSGLADSPLFGPPPSSNYPLEEKTSKVKTVETKLEIKTPPHHDTTVSRVDETIIIDQPVVTMIRLIGVKTRRSIRQCTHRYLDQIMYATSNTEEQNEQV